MLVRVPIGQALVQAYVMPDILVAHAMKEPLATLRNHSVHQNIHSILFKKSVWTIFQKEHHSYLSVVDRFSGWPILYHFRGQLAVESFFLSAAQFLLLIVSLRS